jgi:hypothetical protein
MLVREKITHGLMVDFGLVNAISDWQLFLQGRCEVLKFGLIHPGELGFVIFVKFGGAHLEHHIFIVLSFLGFLIFLAERDVDGNKLAIFLLFPGFVVLAPLLFISFVVV